jgi:ABC-type bacteriocin/lantibiotic exporter with double-glycine peptidase domain
MNSQFFNFVKTLIQATNKDTAEQLRTAEAVNRFVGCSFWALLISMVVMSASAIWLRHQSMVLWKLAFGVAVAYAFALGGIVRHFRYLRNKEACMVFEASFAHRDAIKRLMETGK